MIGTIVNVCAIIVGSAIGLLFRGRMSERMSKIVMQGIGLCIIIIGLKMALGGTDGLGMVLCVVIGTLLGELLKLEDRLDKLGDWLRSKVERNKRDNSTFTEAFVSATIFFTVGAMAILGSLEAGFTGNISTLLAKSSLDGITSIILASALGIGVAFSSIPLLIYQGGITLLAVVLRPLLSDPTVGLMSAAGGVLILAIALKMLGILKIKVSNMLPAIFLPIAYIPLKELISSLI